MQRGFTLIQISILLMVASLVAVATLPSTQNKTALNDATSLKLNNALQALREYEASHASLPCPADASLPVESANYGKAAANPGATSNCAGGSPAANYTDSTNHIAIGMLPVKTLGLPNEAALDAYGRALTYAVDTNATGCFNGTLSGQLTVTDNGTATSSIAVLVSHGADGHGAWVPRTGSTGTAVRLNNSSTDADQLTNAHVDASFTPTTNLSSFIKKSPTASFDDLVAYNSPAWSLNASPVAASALFPTIIPPSNKTYISTQQLAFTANYKQAAVTTGTPRLVLTIGGITRYANYLSGSGTSALNFSYTLQSADYAPTGISIASTIDLNGGTISYGCAGYTAPDLSKVLVKKMYIYVVDYNNNRVEKFDSTGSFLVSFGSYGLLGGLFNHPKQIAADSLGNVWVTDFGNSRVEEFDSNGNYLSQFGSLGILNGQFTNTGSIAIDANNNMWVTDTGNNRIQKFNSSGSYLTQFGSTGTGNGQFLVPTGVATDTSGNLSVGDWGNGRIEQFNSSGTYISQFGSVGSTNGKLINPCGQAYDSSGNIWVADNGNNRVQQFSSGGTYLAQFGTFGALAGRFKGPCGVAIDLTGNIWVADTGNNRVQKFNSSGTYQSQFGSTGIGNGQFSFPIAIGLSYQ